MIGRATILRKCHAPLGYLSPGMIGFEARGSLSTHLPNAKTAPDRYLVRHFPGIQRALGSHELGDGHRLPAAGNPADGLANVKSDMVPILRTLQTGALSPGALRLLQGGSPRENRNDGHTFYPLPKLLWRLSRTAKATYMRIHLISRRQAAGVSIRFLASLPPVPPRSLTSPDWPNMSWRLLNPTPGEMRGGEMRSEKLASDSMFPLSLHRQCTGMTPPATTSSSAWP